NFTMSITQIKNLLLNGPLDAVCGANVVYLAMNGNNLSRYEDIRTLADRAVNSALAEISDTERRIRILEVLPELKVGECRPGRAMSSDVEGFCSSLAVRDYTTKTMLIGHKSVVGLLSIEALNTDRELPQDHSRDEIERNLNTLKSKLEHPVLESDANLYGSLRVNLGNINQSELTWKDPEASMVISDESEIVNKLGTRQKRIFMEPRENMRCVLPNSVVSKCKEFVENFDNTNVPRDMGNIIHNKTWKESESELLKIAERILSVLGEIWSNPAFATSTSRNQQSEGTYITDVIVPLLRASLGDLPNDYICLSTAERQSLASKARRNIGFSGERMGKKPDVMMMIKIMEKIFELAYVESSRINCSKTKKNDDYVKLWRETLDGVSFIDATCRPMANQFGVEGIQVAGDVMYLNVLIKDAGGIPRYFHLDHAEIPLFPTSFHRVGSLLRLLLTLRNIMIVNKSLLMRALEQASSHPPRNVHPSPTVPSPLHDN
ncbi:12516_t:CDS:2, partial [Ambispora leptoticha]